MRWRREGGTATTNLFLAPDAGNERGIRPVGNEIEMICETNLHERQAFPFGRAFRLSRFSGLKGNMQSSSRFAIEHGPHLGERPSHFW